MSFEPNPQQALLIFSMLLGETQDALEPLASKCKLSPKLRNELITKKLIAKVPVPPRSSRLRLTTLGQEWALNNLFCRLPERGARPKLIVERLREALIPMLNERRGEVLRVLLGSKSAVSTGLGSTPPTSAAAEEDALTLASIQDQIREAYLSITHGKIKQRVLLKDLRPKVTAIKSDFDEAVLALQQEEALVLMGLDNMAERTPEVEAAALHIAGHPRHLVYFQG